MTFRTTRQFTCNITLRCFHETDDAVENKYYIFLCVYARMHVCVGGGGGGSGAWASAFARARVALFIQHAKRMRHSLLSFVASPISPYFSTLS